MTGRISGVDDILEGVRVSYDVISVGRQSEEKDCSTLVRDTRGWKGKCVCVRGRGVLGSSSVVDK